jgi:hypothetical protein
MMPLTPNLFAVWITGIGGALVRELQAGWRGEGALLLSLQSPLQSNHIFAVFFSTVEEGGFMRSSIDSRAAGHQL